MLEKKFALNILFFLRQKLLFFSSKDFCPFNYCLRFSKPIFLLKSTLKAIESCGNFKCNILNTPNYKNFTFYFLVI